jgi:hypothetical protein
MDFDAAARRSGQGIRDAVRHVEPPPVAAARAAGRRTNALLSGLGAFAVTVVVLGVGALAGGGGSGPAVAPAASLPAATPVPATTTAPVVTVGSETTSTTPEPAVGWSIAYPADWDRADSELMPDLAWQSLTLATFPLEPGGVRCAYLPENAIRALGPHDAMLTASFTGNPASGAAPWPVGGFDAHVLPTTESTDANDCALPPDLEVRSGSFDLQGNETFLFVAFGADVDEATRDGVWATLTSVRPGSDRPAERAPVCIATRPPLPPFTPPEPYDPAPTGAGSVWYGTDDLWTVLPTDGTFRPTKSVWWSTHFRGGAVESTPAISVTHEPVGSDDPVEHSGELGTNAYTPEDGWFMIADIDFVPSGCWRVTASYRDAVLSYVAEVP